MRLKFPKIFYGWWIIISCFLVSLFQGGFIILGFTAFFEPISNDLGWSYTQLSLAISFRGAETGILAPLVGLLVDHRGPRLLMVGGCILLGISLLAISQTNSLGMFYAAFLLLAFGMSGISPTVLMTAVANWFRKQSGIAIGIINSGFALGGLLVPLVVRLIDITGWRTALIVLAIIMSVSGVPLSLVVRHKPEQYGLLPDGEKCSTDADYNRVLSQGMQETDFTLKQALRSRAFWHIGMAMSLHFAAVGAYITHVMPSLDSVGINRYLAGLVAMIVPLISIAGRIGSGWMSDRYSQKRITILFLAFSTLGLFFFSYTSIELLWLVVPFSLFLGIGWGGANTIRMSLVREYFGRSKYGSIFGFQMGMMAVGMILGPLFAGWVFDNFGTYQPAWIIFAMVVMVALVIMATVPAKATVSTQM